MGGRRDSKHRLGMNSRWLSGLGRIGLMLAVAWLAAACGDLAPAPSIPSWGSLPVANATATAPPPTPTPDELDEARGFRARYGLRADDAWILAVAQADKALAAIDEFGVPLMPFEVQVLHARRTDRDVLRQIQDYGGLHPDQYAGAYVDQRMSMGFVVMFSQNVERHRKTLAGLLPESVHLEVQLVRWSQRDLEAFKAQVEADHGWAGLLGVQYLTVGRRITDDVVYVLYRGPVAAAAAIANYYGSPAWLVVRRDGPLPWSGPRGDLTIDVVDTTGNPVPDLDITFRPLDPEVEGAGATAFGTNARGRCVIANLPAVEYEVTVSRIGPDGRQQILRSVTVRLPEGGRVVRVRIEG